MSDPFRGISAPKEDGWVNLVTGLGTVSRDKTVNTLFCRDLVLAEEDCAALYAHDDLAKKIVDAPLDEAFRKGFKLKAMKEDGTEDEDKSKELQELVCLLEKTARDAFRWARVFGGAGAIANVNGGGAWNSALNPEAVSAVISTPVFDRRFLWPVDLYDDPVTLWREPLTYALATNGFTAKQARAIHESRIFRVVGVEADRRDRQTLNYWGYSALQPVYNTLRRYATADQSALQLLMDASQFVFKIKGVIAAIESGNKKVLQDRMALVDMSRGIGKALILDAEAQEGVERSSASFSGIPDLLDKFMARLAAACGIPVSVLFGVGPAGLNATGELDMEVWRSSIASFQAKELTPFIKRLLCLYANEWDFDPEMVEIDWMPLSEPTMAQTADVRLKVAQADQIYFNMGLPMEVILKSRFANGFSMETEVDVAELDEIAAQAEEDKQAQADLAMAQAKAGPRAEDPGQKGSNNAFPAKPKP